MDYEKEVFNIPSNYSDGLVLLGFVIDTSRFIEGFFLGCLPAVIIFGFNIFGNRVNNIIYSISIAVPFAVVGFAGFRGNSIFTLIKLFFRFLASRRKAYYNPRVKYEIKRTNYSGMSDSVLTKDKMLKLIHAKRHEAQNEEIDLQEEDINNMFFEGDENFVEKPIEYMTNKELKAYRRKERKEKRKKKTKA